MFFKKTYFQKKRYGQNWAIVTGILCLMFLLVPYTAKTEELSNNALPPSPDTGSPEEDFSAAGTRENHLLKNICGETGQKIAYLFGNKNREFTLSAHPSFWFYIPNNIQKVAQLKFIVTELETGKKIYDRTLPFPEKAGVMGIIIPPEAQYSLSANVNYSWSLAVDCVGTTGESEIALEGWLNRLSLSQDLENQLATISPANKYEVYLENDLLYDALDDLAQRRIAEPNNIELETAWNQLLVELGWQDLTPNSVVEPYLLN